jgi:hypothetical protein
MTPDELLEGIRAADRHQGGLRCLRLHRIAGDAFAAVRSEVDRLCRRGRPSDVRRPDHVTSWVLPYGSVLQFSLLNTSGRFDDFRTDHDLTRRDKRFAAAADYPALAELVAALPDAVNVRVNLLGPASGLMPHEEHLFVRAPNGAVVARVRFHLPVATNPGALVVLDGDAYHLEPGVVHFVNHGCLHAARNRGEHPRIHLVWDMVLTQAVYEVMFGDSACPSPLQRITGPARRLAASHTERLGASRRLPPQVSQQEAAGALLAPADWHSARVP